MGSGEDLYGYRPHKSALDAVEKTRKRCWKYDYVIELDVKGLFDNIDHELLMRVVRRHVKEPWICLYIERWLKSPFVLPDGSRIERESGTPQGSVISPVLVKMILHYIFDMWMKEISHRHRLKDMQMMELCIVDTKKKHYT